MIIGKFFGIIALGVSYFYKFYFYFSTFSIEKVLSEILRKEKILRILAVIEIFPRAVNGLKKIHFFIFRIF